MTIARQRGIDVVGPLPPDTAFLPARRRNTDCIVCIYHDQGHIPLKTLAFDQAVNTTLGLPIIRTSVDHGTALELAGYKTVRGAHGIVLTTGQIHLVARSFNSVSKVFAFTLSALFVDLRCFQHGVHAEGLERADLDAPFLPRIDINLNFRLLEDDVMNKAEPRVARRINRSRGTD